MITLNKEELSLFDTMLSHANDEINERLADGFSSEDLRGEMGIFSLLKKIRAQCVEW